MNEHNPPFEPLGKHLKFVREQSRQSLSEVSGAVEIDEQMLERIEAGEERPAEDVLLLLISHFGVQDQEAIQLWELANYDGEMPDQIRTDGASLQTGGKPVVMLLAMDMRTIYSDGIEINGSQAGLTLNFTQISGRQARPMPVARVGMSYEQAAAVYSSLGIALMKAKYLRGRRSLPPQSQTDPHSQNPES